MATMNRTLADYTVGWLCVLASELAAAISMLDEVHDDLSTPCTDQNVYTLGSIKGHNIVIASTSETGVSSAATTATQMVGTFPSLRFGLLVGIGGGIPTNGVRLGDVVVSVPSGMFPGVVQWDMGKAENGKFVRTGALNKPPSILLAAQKKLEAFFRLRRDGLDEILSSGPHELCNPPSFERTAGYQYVKDIKIHYGLIASGSQVIKDAKIRDIVNTCLDGKVLCIEMEAAGLPDNFPCLVIRGISDLADTQKGDSWQPYAAMVAAAYAKRLLQKIVPQDVKEQILIQEHLGEIHKTTSQTGNQVSRIYASIEKGDHAKILQWLTDADHIAQHEDIQHRVQKGTGEWLLNSSQYESWLATGEQRLFCHGIPGAGKTFITAIVINDLHQKYAGNSDIGIVYFYCSFQHRDRHRDDALRLSFLKQLAGQYWNRFPKVDVVEELYQAHQQPQRRPPPDQVGKALKSVIETFTQVFIVVDALDEWGHSGNIPAVLVELAYPKTGLFATSRPIKDIVERFNGSPQIEIRAHDSDLDIYLDASLLNSRSAKLKNRKDLQQTIKEMIKKSVAGMFLLARLYFDDVQNQVTEADIENTLEKFEKQAEKEDLLAAAYDEAIERIKSQPKKFARLAQKVLGWISCAKRPLTKSELQHALAVKQDASVFNHKDIPEISDIVSACAGLVAEEKETETLRLSHYTAQEYFEQQTRQYKSWFSTAETEIARACMKYLSFETSLPRMGKEEEEFNTLFGLDTGIYHRQSVFSFSKSWVEFVKLYPLFIYASQHWADHAYRAALPPEETLKTLEFFLPEGRIGKLNLEDVTNVPRPKMHILRDVPSESSRSPAPHIWKRLLRLAAYFGLPGLVKLLLLPNGYYPDDTADISITPLCYAAQQGHKATVQELLKDTRVDVNGYDEEGKTPLLLALGGGHATIAVLILADKRFDFNSVSETGERALHLAIREGYAGVVSCLVNGGVTEYTTDKKNILTPLTHAAKLGRQSIAEILLAAGADANARVPLYWTPLIYAVAGGHHSMIHYLLAQGADVNGGTPDGQTPLICAARAGHHSIVQTLLENGADINRGTSNGQTPLTCAAQAGHHSIVETLVAESAKINAGLPSGWTALTLAVQAGHKSTVGALLAAGIDVNAKGTSGWTPLTLAAMEGHDSIVELLLAANAIPNPKDAKGRTPIHWAIIYGHDPVVKLLLPFKNAEDDGSLSESLWRGFRREHFSVVTTLIVHGDVDPDHVPEGGLVLLHWALKFGHSVVVQHLLQRDLNDQHFKRRFGEYPLWIAANEGHCEIVRILLERREFDMALKSKILRRAFSKRYWAVANLLLTDNRAEWSQQPKLMSTLLMSAANGGASEIIELLLCYLDVSFLNATDMNQQTSLHHAATHGHIMMIESLLKNPGILPNIKDKNSQTPLAIAARNGHHQAVELLLNDETIRSRINETDGDGLTALALAAKNGSVQVLEILLGTRGVNPNTLDPNEQTALSLAAQKGHCEIVDLLLGNEGTDRLTKDRNGRTPLGFAIRNGWASVVRRLLEDNSIRNKVENGELEWGFQYAVSDADTEVLKVFVDMDINY